MQWHKLGKEYIKRIPKIRTQQNPTRGWTIVHVQLCVSLPYNWSPVLLYSESELHYSLRIFLHSYLEFRHCFSDVIQATLSKLAYGDIHLTSTAYVRSFSKLYLTQMSLLLFPFLRKKAQSFYNAKFDNAHLKQTRLIFVYGASPDVVGYVPSGV